MLAASAPLVALLLVGLVAVPVAKWVRSMLRRRGRPERAVVGAWREARDRLRDHGVAARPGTTVRDLAVPAGAMAAGSGAELERLARCVDATLYSGAAVDRAVADGAWRATKGVRRALATRPLRERIRAALRLRTWGGGLDGVAVHREGQGSK